MTYYLYYEKVDGQFRILNGETGIMTVISRKEHMKQKHTFHLMAGYDADDKGLFKYWQDFKEWITQLKKNKICNIDVLYYFSLHILALQTFKRFAKGKYEFFEPVEPIEEKWSNRCNNGGLLYGEDITTDSFGYDYKKNYPKILASRNIYFPSKKGKQIKLDELPKINEIETGYYNVRITCNDKNFRKIFAFSKDNVYTDRSLYQSMKYQDEFNVKIELVTTVKYNAYVYDKKDLISGDKIFGTWNRKLTALAEEFPKNKIVKHLMSSLWGQLSRKKVLCKTWDQMEKEGLNVGWSDDHEYILIKKVIKGSGENEYDNYYEMYKRDEIYEYPLRLKSFLTAYARNKTARVCMGNINYGINADTNVKHNLDNVVRVCVDCVVFKTKQTDLEGEIIPSLIPENKCTGVIEWKNTNKYYNKTTNKYHGKWKDEEKG